MLINELLTLTPKIFLILRLGIKVPMAHRPILLRLDSLAYSATTELLMYAQGKQKAKVAMRDDTKINVENPQWWEKPRQLTDC